MTQSELEAALASYQFWKDIGQNILLAGLVCEILVVSWLHGAGKRETVGSIVSVLIIVIGVGVENFSGNKADDIVRLMRALRILASDQVAALTKAMADFKGISFDVAMDEDRDSRHLMAQLLNALVEANWALKSWTGPPPGEQMNVGEHGEIKLAFMPLDGLQVGYDATHEKDFGPAAKALVAALNHDGIDATTWGPKHFTNMGADVIHLFVGEKQ